MAPKIAFCVIVALNVQLSSASRLATKQMRTLIGEEEENVSAGWNGCNRELVVEFDEDPDNLVHGPALTGGHLAFTDWENVELFVKQERNECSKSYKAECSKGGLVTTRSCSGLETEDVEFRCLGGATCLKAKFRNTAVTHGATLILRFPTTKGDTCDFAMTSGYVKYYTSTIIGTDTPRADDVAVVAAAAAKLSGSDDECGSVAMDIRRDPRNAAENLAVLAQIASDVAEEQEDAEAQILNSLLARYFESEHQKFSLWPKNFDRIQNLADNIKLVYGLQRQQGVLSSHAKQADSPGMRALAHYYGSLQERPNVRSGRRALIFTCSFGGGHKSAAKAVADALKKAGFDAIVIDTTYDKNFRNMGNEMGAKVFNDFIIKRQNYLLFNVMDKMNQFMGPLEKPCPSPVCDNDRKQQFRNAVLDHRPDLIVTVYHMELVPTLEIAKELGNIPVLHIATDIDIKMKELFHSEMIPVYPKFLAGIPFDLEESYETIQPMKKEQTFLSGYPVRSAFLTRLDDERIAIVAAEKNKFVPAGTKIMLVMTGGGGQDTSWPYRLAEKGIGMPLHIVIVAGGNNRLIENLRARLPGEKIFGDRTVMHGDDPSVTIEVAIDDANTNAEKPYYVLEDRLAMLLDMADVVLAKPGGGSTAEIAYRGVPAIFDTSITLFHWELFTVKVFEREQRGIAFEDEDQLREAIPQAIGLGRSQKLAEENGELLDTSARVVEAAERVLTFTCQPCKVFEIPEKKASMQTISTFAAKTRKWAAAARNAISLK